MISSYGNQDLVEVEKVGNPRDIVSGCDLAHKYATKKRKVAFEGTLVPHPLVHSN